MSNENEQEKQGQGPEEKVGEEKEIAPEVPATDTPEILDPVGDEGDNV